MVYFSIVKNKNLEIVIDDTGFGISEQVKIAKTDDKSEIYSRGYTRLIKNEEDLEKIKSPR